MRIASSEELNWRWMKLDFGLLIAIQVLYELFKPVWLLRSHNRLFGAKLKQVLRPLTPGRLAQLVRASC